MAAMRYFYLLEVLLVATHCCSSVMAGTIIYKKITDGVLATGQSQKGFSVLDCALICAKDTSVPCRRFSYHADNKYCYLFNSTESLDGSSEDTYGRQCPLNLGFTLFNNRHCLKYYMTPRNYTDAEEDCRNVKAHLLTVTKLSDFGLLGDTAITWIDGGKSATTWYGMPLPMTMWSAGYPKSNECPYVNAMVPPPVMLTSECSLKHQYICQIDC